RLFFERRSRSEANHIVRRSDSRTGFSEMRTTLHKLGVFWRASRSSVRLREERQRFSSERLQDRDQVVPILGREGSCLPRNVDLEEVAQSTGGAVVEVGGGPGHAAQRWRVETPVPTVAVVEADVAGRRDGVERRFVTRVTAPLREHPPAPDGAWVV